MVAKALNIVATIVGVGFATVIVTGKYTSSIITAFGNAFSGSLRTAMGG